ncbi:MAG: hypothetical protein AB2693_35235 [Candidatus Thiodiazotropha sp.]
MGLYCQQWADALADQSFCMVHLPLYWFCCVAAQSYFLFLHQLPEGLAMDAAKALCSLICFSTDRRFKMKFIEACIDNLARHLSLVVSLSIFPKIFNSFQRYRSGVDTHTITMWAEKELDMMTHFFINLIHYKELHKAEEVVTPMSL